MSILLEKNIILTPLEKDFFEFVQGDSFPWYYSGYSIDPDVLNEYISSKNILYTHICMHRAEGNKKSRGKENSDYLIPSEQFFMRICKDNNINVNTIYRVAYNCTFYSQESYDTFHQDHNFNHKIFIFYINKFNRGSTFIKNENDELVEIKAQQHKVVVFDDCKHAQGFCELYQRRLALVITFS